VARAAERSTDQFRKGMKAFLYSCLVAAVSAVDEHSKSTLDGLVKDNGKTLFESDSDSRTEKMAKSFRVPTLTAYSLRVGSRARPANDVVAAARNSLSPRKEKRPTHSRAGWPFSSFLLPPETVPPEGVRIAVPACALAEARSSLNRQRAVAEPGRRNGLARRIFDRVDTPPCGHHDGMPAVGHPVHGQCPTAVQHVQASRHKREGRESCRNNATRPAIPHTKYIWSEPALRGTSTSTSGSCPCFFIFALSPVHCPITLTAPLRFASRLCIHLFGCASLPEGPTPLLFLSYDTCGSQKAMVHKTHFGV